MIVYNDVVVNPAEAPTTPERTEQSLSELGVEVWGADWGESAAGQSGSEPKTRTITLDLVCRKDSEVSLAEAAYRLQRIIGSMQEEPETWIKRVPEEGFAGPVMYRIRRSPTAEEPQVTLSGLGGWQVGDNQPVTLTIVADYPAYSTEEVEGEEHSTTTERHLIYTEDAPGGSTKGLRRIRVTNDNEEGDWRGLIFASECREYDSAETAKPWYECNELTLNGGTEFEEGYLLSPVLTKGWQTIMSTEIDGVGHMTHRGGRRIWMRVGVAVEPNDVQLRLFWRVLGSSRWEEGNPIVSVAGTEGDHWFLADLGTVLPQVPTLGDQRWEGKVMARAIKTGANQVYLRDFYVLPTEQYMVMSEPFEPPVSGEVIELPETAEDNSGVGTVAWANPGNVKDWDETPAVGETEAKEVVQTHYLKATNFGFALPEDVAILGVKVDISRRKNENLFGVVSDNRIRIIQGGTIKEAQDKASATGWPTSFTTATYGGSTDLWGQSWIASNINSSGFGVAISAQLSHLTGLPIGGWGLRKAEIDWVAISVFYSEPGSEENRVCFASRSIEIRSNGIGRQAPEGDAWGSVVPDGFLPYATPGALEGRTQRTIIIPTQGDLEERADTGTPNKLTAQEFVRPGYHVARGAL